MFWKPGQSRWMAVSDGSARQTTASTAAATPHTAGSEETAAGQDRMAIGLSPEVPPDDRRGFRGQ